MTEQECVDQVIKWERQFGWTGTYLTRQDAESVMERDLTDTEWETVRTSYHWTDIGEELADLAMGWIADTLNLVGIE